MHLCESEGLLGESARYFVCVYEHFQFKETQLLKDYLDFIVHEPVEWLKAFPERLKTKSSFAKPKSALIKLLKHERVVQTLGEEYLKNIHDVIWVTFKKHGDAILATRQKTDTIEHVEDYDSDDVSEQKPSLLIHDCDIDAVSMDSARLPNLPNNSDKRCALLTNLVRTLICDYQGSCPALVTVTLQLLDEISKPQNEIL